MSSLFCRSHLALAAAVATSLAAPPSADAADGIKATATVRCSIPADTLLVSFNLNDRLTVDQILTTSPGQRA